MRIFLVALLFLQGCIYNSSELNRIPMDYHDKAYFNQDWRKQGLSKEEWYYRTTVIEAPMNSRALNIGEGHWLHPDVLRWEITKDFLIGWRPNASVLGADHEFSEGAQQHYRGAPIVAFVINSHFDIDETAQSSKQESVQKPWYERQFIRVDWSQNAVSRLRRNDINDGIESLDIKNVNTHVVENNFLGNPKRARFSKLHMEFVTRHPIEVAKASLYGVLGEQFGGDAAASVIDIRHAFLKKSRSDFIPLPYPDHVGLVNEKREPILDSDKKEKRIPINARIGLFRTNFSGRKIYDQKTGTSDKSVVNATLFNIWKKSRDDQGAIIPMEQREPKPIVYYTNVLHPNDLLGDSQNVAKEWDMALRTAVFYAQPSKYPSIEAVPAMWILKNNDCNPDTVGDWLLKKYASLKESVERDAQQDYISVKNELELIDSNREKLSFHRKTVREIAAKRKLEQICAALEFYTEELAEPFVYQRTGDMRFNMINLEVSNNITSWSGYGPMLADELTGEILSATANINLKYINEKAQKISKHMSLLNRDDPSLQAVFGSGVDGMTDGAVAKIRSNAMNSPDRRNKSVDFSSKIDTAISQAKLSALAQIKSTLGNETQNSLGLVSEHLDQILPSDSHHKKISQNRFDPLSFIDDISIAVAFKFAKLSDDERFLKIRSAIYKSVLLHELGHNLGLEHNMSSSADVLNYGPNFWWLQSLPQKLADAKPLIDDPVIVEKIRDCIKDNEQYSAKLQGRELSTQECLQQKMGMYASIMDYHASALADTQGLGLYDKAAIKWAYAQLVEIFPKENLVVDANQIEISKWIRLNDYRLMPQALLKNAQAINQRHHAKFTWDAEFAARALPSTTVPYLYCNDPSGLSNPRCAAFDFGADMESSARWLKSRFWNNYLLTYFAKDALLTPQEAATQSLKNDLDILERFNKMLRWYYKNLQDDKDFAGSFAEKDYLKALAIGMNHFAHVLGLPNSGGHITAPIWSREDRNLNLSSKERLAPLHTLIPFDDLSRCEAESLTKLNERKEVQARGDYRFVNVSLGMGRPYNDGYTQDLEQRKKLFLGTSLLKKYAILLLGSSMNEASDISHVEQKELFDMSWYNLFPEAVGKLLGAIIKEKYEDIGPILNDKNEITARDIIDENTFKIIDHGEVMSIMPTQDADLPLLAMTSAAAFLSERAPQSANFKKAMRISCIGCNGNDDNIDIDGEQISYMHLSGHEYRALKISGVESVGADLLAKANQEKNTYLSLVACLDSENRRTADPFCHCVKTADRRSFDDWTCCSESNPKCQQPELEAVGDGACSVQDLEIRKNKSLDRLDAIVGFIDEMRRLPKAESL